jgi:hypothetical protein
MSAVPNCFPSSPAEQKIAHFLAKIVGRTSPGGQMIQNSPELL